jgi:hypothetical protein
MLWRSSKEKEDEDDYEDKTIARRHDAFSTHSDASSSQYYSSQPPFEPALYTPAIEPAPSYTYAAAASPPPPAASTSFSAKDVLLNLGSKVYLSGPNRNKDTTKADVNIQIHVLRDKRGFFPVEYERWKMFRMIERNISSFEFQGSEMGIISLQDSNDTSKNITVSWKEFTNNFTPLSVDESSKMNGANGFLFASRDWNVNGANPNPTDRKKDNSSRISSRSLGYYRHDDDHDRSNHSSRHSR